MSAASDARPRRPRLPLALLAPLLAIASGCGERASGPTEPEGPALTVRRVAVRDLACTDPCGFELTYETRVAATEEPAAATLELTGDGWYPRRVSTTLPEGRATFYWEFPRPKVSGTSYRLTICPEVGDCVTQTATIHLPDDA